ncbi:MAG: drug:proton antiporter [Myxococcota bacterium]
MIRVERLAPAPREADQTQGAHAHCRAIRTRVFVEEQAVPATEEWDGLDGEAIHFLAWSDASMPPCPVGTARLRLLAGFAKAERVAVLRDARGRRVGLALMRALEERPSPTARASSTARAGRRDPLLREARLPRRGPVFAEAGIDHRRCTSPRRSLAADLISLAADPSCSR